MDCSSTVLWIVACVFGIYYFFFRNLRHFEGTGIPYVKPVQHFCYLTGFLLRKRRWPEILETIYNLKRDAKYVGFFDMMTPTIILRDPELIKSIGVKHFDNFPNHRGVASDGQDPLFSKNLFSLQDQKWREVRNLLTPAFTSSKMKSMFCLMSDCAQRFTDFLAKLPEAERNIEMKESFGRYSTDVIATCAYGISVDSMKDPNNEFYTMSVKSTFFTGWSNVRFLLVRSMPKLMNFLGITILEEDVAKFFNHVIATTIQHRDQEGITRPDMIQLLMDTRGKLGPGRELTIEDITAQAFIFFTAGFDSTSSLMCFVAYSIGTDSNVQARLQEEIDEVLMKHGKEVTYEAINNMEYLEAIINESLRMYPVFTMIDRMCTKNFELPPALPGLKPYVMKQGSAVWFPIYPLHRDPAYFENPNKFDPDRFLRENKKNVSHSAFIPFGIGPRMCIGNRFALLETKVLIFHLLSRCNLKPCARTPIPMKFSKGLVVLTAEDGFWLDVQPRNNSFYIDQDS